MPLELHPCTESDLTRFTYIVKDAFSSGEPGMMHLLTPNPIPADYIQKSTDKHLKSFREEKDVTYLKIVDTDLGGKMIAGAKWRINRKERTEEQIQSMLPVPGKDEEGRQGIQDFFWFLNRMRREYMGTKPFYRQFDDSLLLWIALTRVSLEHTCDRSRASSERSWDHVAQMGFEASRRRSSSCVPGVVANGSAAVCQPRIRA